MSNLSNGIERLRGRENFQIWKIASKAYLTSKGYWKHFATALSASASAADLSADEKALSELILIVDSSIYSYLDGIEKAKDAWDCLCNIFEDKGAVRKVTLLKQWITLQLDDCSSMHDYVNKSLNLRAKIKTAGFDIGDEISGCIMLCGLNDDFKPLIMSLETKSDTLKVDFVKNILLQEVEYDNCNENALSVKHKKNKNGKFKNSNKNKKNIKCYECGGPHFKNKCPKLKNGEKNEIVLYSNSFVAETDDAENVWFLDSGASAHMTKSDVNIINKKKPMIKEVKVANDQRIRVNHYGDIACKIGEHEKSSVILKDVQYLPDICVNLLSVSKMAKNGNTIIFDASGCKIYNKNNDIIASGNLINGMYKVKTQSIKRVDSECTYAVRSNENNSLIWHKRLAHANMNTVNSMFNFKEKTDLKCVVCIKAKMSRKPFNNIGTRATKILEIVHSDVCGPFSVRSHGHAHYFVSFIDDFTRKVFAYPIKSKSDVFTKFVEFKNYVENQSERKIKILRSDNGTEYINNAFSNFLIKYGIKHEKSAPYSPQQNGLAERMNRTILEKVRCMLIESNLSKQFWAEAVHASAEIINMIPNSMNKKSPNDMWGNNKSDLNKLKIFGCKAMVWLPEQKRKKLDSKAFECIYLRYSSDAKAYRLYDTNKRKIVISRDVVFLENEKLTNDTIPNTSLDIFSWQNDSVDDANADILDATNEIIQSNPDEDHGIVNSRSDADVLDVTNANNQPEISEEHGIVDSGGEIDSTLDDKASDVISVGDSTLDDEASDEIAVGDSTLDDEENDEIENDPTFNTRAKIDENASRPKTRNFFDNILNFHVAFVVGEPNNYKQAMTDENSDKWMMAMREEYNSLIKNGTWKLVERPKDVKVVDNKWVYKIKKNQDGTATRYKARLVARGFTQQYGVNYHETFSPVVRFTSIRIILSIAAQRRMMLKQFDVKTAFLNGDLKECVYMEQPMGFSNGSNQVCKLMKSLYGLKQASRAFNEKFTYFIRLFGFITSKVDPCVFISKCNGKLTIMAIHVDDGLIVSDDGDYIDLIINHLNKNFEVTSMDIGTFLGLEIKKFDDGSIFIHQTEYAKKVLEKFNMQNCNGVSTPGDPNQVLHRFDESEKSTYPYRELVGSLMYLSIATRPDITHALIVASRYMEQPTLTHERAVKRILKYINKTFNHGIFYSSNQTLNLDAYSDANFAGDIDTRRSTSGFVCLYNGPISWCSELQKCVSLSTAESEYIAGASCVRELVWLKNIFCEILGDSKFKINLFMDNESAIRLTKNPEFHKRSKHIDIKYHFIREKFSENLFKIGHVSTNDMIADIFTKSLPAQKFNFFKEKMNIVSM